MTRIIDLANYRSPDVRVFAGRERGAKVREAAKVDELDGVDEVVEVRVPDDLFSVNSSFFLGMFGPSIRFLGETEFRRRYRFVGKNIQRVTEECIKEALRTGSPLAGRDS